MTNTPQDLNSFATRLLQWWDKHGRKDLPWQHPRTPYRVWVSEIMLQQTQVSTVIDYFLKFMRRFPDLASLANAPQDDVLAHWAGLGYYARARNLHKAARVCVDQHQGQLPTSAAELVDLPGIGLSTANAIISQSQDIPATVLDGNVKRVVARHAAIDGWPGKTAVHRQLEAAADKRLSNIRGADYTQAIMDLGATLCTRANPSCMICPVHGDCRALSQGDVRQYPGAKPRTKVREQSLFMLVLMNEDQQVLLEKRPPAGIWGGLWCLPEAASAEAFDERFELASLKGLKPFEHRLTHRLFKITPLLGSGSLANHKVADHNELRWQALETRETLGLPKPVETILAGIEAKSH